MRTHITKKLTTLASMIALVTLCADAQAAVVFAQPAIDDAIVRSSANSKNYGTEPLLELKTSPTVSMLLLRVVKVRNTSPREDTLR